MTTKIAKQTKVKTTKKPKKGSLEAIFSASDKLRKQGIKIDLK